jgi:hypothetical protein
VNAHARYYRDCLKAALKDELEPLGKAYGLHRDEAVEIRDSVWTQLTAVGIPTPQKWEEKATAAQDARVVAAYRRAGLRA